MTARPTLGLTPVEWAESHATIVHPSRGRVPFVPYPYQRDFLASYATPRRIVLKARQIGFSQVFALEALYAAIHEPESTILLVSRSQDLAVNLLRYCYQAYGNLISAPALKKQNESEMGFVSGSRIKSIPANRTTGRGFAATRVYLDEFAYADRTTPPRPGRPSMNATLWDRAWPCLTPPRSTRPSRARSASKKPSQGTGMSTSPT
jgi:hypothetical protein